RLVHLSLLHPATVAERAEEQERRSAGDRGWRHIQGDAGRRTSAKIRHQHHLWSHPRSEDLEGHRQEWRGAQSLCAHPQLCGWWEGAVWTLQIEPDDLVLSLWTPRSGGGAPQQRTFKLSEATVTV